VKRGELLEAEFWRSVLPMCGLEPRDVPYGPLQFLLQERLDEGVMAVARRLRPDYQMALLSNATLSYEQRWLEFGLFELFNVVVNSARVGMAKPDPEIYRLTLDWLGRAPDECLFIDDKPRNTRAAEALGIPSIAFTTAADLTARLLDLDVLAPLQTERDETRPNHR
jgi:FMN phosphatase YigB (HAD superfamily)